MLCGQVGEPLLDLRVAEGTELHGATVVEEDGAEPAQPSEQSVEHADPDRSAPPRTPDITAAPPLPIDSQQPVSSASAASEEASSSAAGDDSPTMEPHRVASTPAVRRLAKELSVDINRVPGTGPNGRVVRGVSRTQEVMTATCACLGSALPANSHVFQYTSIFNAPAQRTCRLQRRYGTQDLQQRQPAQTCRMTRLTQPSSEAEVLLISSQQPASQCLCADTGPSASDTCLAPAL